jgi:hypothetical protein
MECVFNLNIYSLIISSIALAFAISYIFIKPRLDIYLTCLSENQLSIKVRNKGCGSAINLKIEACVLDCAGGTYHLKIDKSGFIMLPPKRKGDNIRIFKTRRFSKSAFEYLDNKNTTVEDIICQYKKVRVRIHSEQGFTGFGKAITQEFEYINNQFKKL